MVLQEFLEQYLRERLDHRGAEAEERKDANALLHHMRHVQQLRQEPDPEKLLQHSTKVR